MAVIPEQQNSREFTLMALFARIDIVAMAIAIAVVLASGLALATAVLLLQGAPEGISVGSNLAALGNIFPGYSVTWLGLMIGAVWAGLVGVAAGILVATIWNFTHIVFLGVLAFGYPRQATSSLGQEGFCSARRQDPPSEDQKLVSAAARLNVATTALGAGLGLGLLLFMATHISLDVANHPGRYLNLLGILMPGYSASSVGAWFGLLWGLIYGAVSGGVIAWFYVRSLGTDLPRLVIWDEASLRRLRAPVLRISGHAFGMAIGAVAAVALMISTLWLVLRGTADLSVHAKLLSHYLPGYSVSVPGSLMGGIEMFLLLYLFGWLLGAIYNAIALRFAGGKDKET